MNLKINRQFFFFLFKIKFVSEASVIGFQLNYISRFLKYKSLIYEVYLLYYPEEHLNYADSKNDLRGEGK